MWRLNVCVYVKCVCIHFERTVEGSLPPRLYFRKQKTKQKKQLSGQWPIPISFLVVDESVTQCLLKSILCHLVKFETATVKGTA